MGESPQSSKNKMRPFLWFNLGIRMLTHRRYNYIDGRITAVRAANVLLADLAAYASATQVLRRHKLSGPESR